MKRATGRDGAKGRLVEGNPPRLLYIYGNVRSVSCNSLRSHGSYLLPWPNSCGRPRRYCLRGHCFVVLARDEAYTILLVGTWLLKIFAISVLGNAGYLLATRSATGGIAPIESSGPCVCVLIAVADLNWSATILTWLSWLSRFARASDSATLSSITANSASIFRCSRSNLEVLCARVRFIFDVCPVCSCCLVE